ncbi:MAG TPA: peptide-N4-asparagine amidase [Rhodanobacteraceae bacterium]|nr:peptide-N4-asparagine amidase [Rhodanobacteraceae bacterium]
MAIFDVRFAVLAAALAASSSAFALPPIGSEDVSIADPDIPPPSSEPCIVPLFDEFTFIGFDAQAFDYAPPDDCPGPWEKVVLRADFDVTAGRQFDRTAAIWLGGANIYFGTTEEPRAAVAPTWHIERDLTDYSVLFTAAHAGRVDLGNLVDDTYTGIIHGSASLVFYPRVPSDFDVRPRPDVVRALAADESGGTVALASPDDKLAVTFALPRNIRRAFLDVIVEAQGGDEFWYLCVPDDLADELFSCPGTGYRVADVTVDGIVAGVAPIYPWIYTGGIDPGLWRPSPGIQALAFEPYRVDLTPYAAWLGSGQPHEVAVHLFNARDHFSATANLLLYLDHGADEVDGELTMNTLELPSYETSNDLTTSGNDISGTVSVVSSRSFSIEGYVDTSDGRVTTNVTQQIEFSNAQTFDIVGDDYRQRLQQTTTIDSTTTVAGKDYSHVVTEHREWPLAIDYAFDAAEDGSATQVTTIEQGLSRSAEFGIDGYEPRGAALVQTMHASDTLLFDAGGNATGRTDQSSEQSYSYADAYGACYSRTIETSAGALTGVTDGADCPNGINALSWFDAFANTGSLVFGATLQILP